MKIEAVVYSQKHFLLKKYFLNNATIAKKMS